MCTQTHEGVLQGREISERWCCVRDCSACDGKVHALSANIVGSKLPNMCALMAPLLRLPCAWLQGMGTPREDILCSGLRRPHKWTRRVRNAGVAEIMPASFRNGMFAARGYVEVSRHLHKTYTAGRAISALITQRMREGHKYTLSEMLVQFVLLLPAQQRFMVVFVLEGARQLVICLCEVHCCVVSHTVSHIH